MNASWKGRHVPPAGSGRLAGRARSDPIRPRPLLEHGLVHEAEREERLIVVFEQSDTVEHSSRHGLASPHVVVGHAREMALQPATCLSLFPDPVLVVRAEVREVSEQPRPGSLDTVTKGQHRRLDPRIALDHAHGRPREDVRRYEGNTLTRALRPTGRASMAGGERPACRNKSSYDRRSASSTRGAPR